MQKTIGAFEKVSFPEFGLNDVIAKVDTGALSGALHATDIRVVVKKDGSKILKFKPFGRDKEVSRHDFRRKTVRASNGEIERRYLIPTTIMIAGERYPVSITLKDRTPMMKGVLIGRRFLRNNGFLVDSKQGTQYRFHVK